MAIQPTGQCLINLMQLCKIQNEEARKTRISSIISSNIAQNPSFKKRYCVLCKKNGETEEFYQSHVLKDSNGKVVCPVLYNHDCDLCGATGENAHTRSKCPLIGHYRKLHEGKPTFYKFCNYRTLMEDKRAGKGTSAEPKMGYFRSRESQRHPSSHLTHGQSSANSNGWISELM